MYFIIKCTNYLLVHINRSVWWWVSPDSWILMLLLIKSHLGDTRSRYRQPEYIWHISLRNRGHPRHIRESVSSHTPSISANEMAMCSLVWTHNLTFTPSQAALADPGCRRIQGDRPQHHNMQQICVVRGDKVAPACSLSGLTFPKACAPRLSLFAVAMEMKYPPPPGSHLAPNWAALLLFSPFRLWLSLLQSDGWKQV